MRLCAAAVVALLLGATRAFSAGIAWTPIGPATGYVDFVVTAPSAPEIVYAASRIGGVLVSSDAGVTWRIANSGLGDLRVTSLAVSPADASVVYVGTLAGGFRTADGGASWKRLGSSFPTSIVDAIAIDPSHPSTLYAVGSNGTLSKSTDAGQAWSNFGNEEVAAAQPQRLTIDPTRTTTLYLATAIGGVFRSADAGRTWESSTSGLENSHGDRSTVSVVAVDPSAPSRLYAGTTTDGIFLSTDSGSHWTPQTDGLWASTPPVFLYSVSDIVVLADGTAYASQQFMLFMLSRGASAWSALEDYFANNHKPVTINAIALGPGSPPAIDAGMGRAGYDGGFAVLDRNGIHWTGLPLGVVTSLVEDPETPRRFLVAAASGLFERQLDAVPGAWALLDQLSAVIPRPTCVFFDALHPGVVYAASGLTIYKSLDAGQTIATTRKLQDSTGFPGPIIRAFLGEPGGSGIFVATSQGLFSSTDDGESWVRASLDLWGREIYTLLADPVDALALWAGLDDGVYRSADAGVHWSRVGGPSGSVGAILPASGRGSTMYAGGESGLSASSDGGATWRSVPAVAAKVNAIAQDPVSGALLAGTTGGIFESGDGGETWTAANHGLTNPEVLCLTASSTGSVLAGTRGGSVFQSIVTAAREAIVRAAAPATPRSVPRRR